MYKYTLSEIIHVFIPFFQLLLFCLKKYDYLLMMIQCLLFSWIVLKNNCFLYLTTDYEKSNNKFIYFQYPYLKFFPLWLEWIACFLTTFSVLLIDDMSLFKKVLLISIVILCYQKHYLLDIFWNSYFRYIFLFLTCYIFYEFNQKNVSILNLLILILYLVSLNSRKLLKNKLHIIELNLVIILMLLIRYKLY